MDLQKKHCVPCEGGVEPYSAEKISEYIKVLGNPWEVIDGKSIKCTFKFEKYLDGVDFAKKVGELADTEGHHPDIHIYFKKVEIELSTHAIKGLSENDFILASKIENLD